VEKGARGFMHISIISRFLFCRAFYFLFLPTVLAQVSLDLNLPDRSEIYLRSIQSGYSLSSRLNPFYLRGDFDGDSVVDYAFLVTSKKTKENGIAFYLSSQKKTLIIGAGAPFNKMTDLDFNGWFVYGKQKVFKGVAEGIPPVLKSEALFIKWEESASAIVYWDGQKFRWYQQGD
jgi:hypothetical protein